MRTLIGVVAVLAVALAVAAGLFVIDPPWIARAEKFDSRRISDLRAIVAAVGEFYRHGGEAAALPESLDPVEKNVRARRGSLQDPRNGTPYEYEMLTPRSFRLCAEFEREGSRRFGNSTFRVEDGPVLDYGPGRTCFDFALNPEAVK